MTRSFAAALRVGVLIVAAFLTSAFSSSQVQALPLSYAPPRPSFSGFHIGMPEDSAYINMRRVAIRSDTLHVDSVTLLESDSVRFFGQPAYVQLQIIHKQVRTIVINWHPLGGSAYTGLRDVLDSYLERFMGRG